MAGSIFDLPGPLFLLLYLVVGIIVIIVVRLAMLQREAEAPTARVDLKEPLTIAYLRGGAREVIRLSLFSLIDRELLVFDGKTVCAKSEEAGAMLRRPLEKAILRRAASPIKPKSLIDDRALQAMCREHSGALRSQGLVASDETHAARLPIVLIGAIFLGALALFKLMRALSGGHSNVLFLIVLTIVFLLILVGMYRRERSGRGDAALANLKVLLEARKNKSESLRAGSGNDDALLLAAVYGFGVLPPGKFPYLKTLFPKNNESSSSCGSSCGSGCGGGGCGGGCGGCGS